MKEIIYIFPYNCFSSILFEYIIKSSFTYIYAYLHHEHNRYKCKLIQVCYIGNSNSIGSVSINDYFSKIMMKC